MMADFVDEIKVGFVPSIRVCAARWLSNRVTRALLLIRPGTKSTLCRVIFFSQICWVMVSVTGTVMCTVPEPTAYRFMPWTSLGVICV